MFKLIDTGIILYSFSGNVLRYVSLANTTYSHAVNACLNLSLTLFDPINFNPSLLSHVLNIPEDVTKIWTPITREFLWRNENGTYFLLEQFFFNFPISKLLIKYAVV